MNRYRGTTATDRAIPFLMGRTHIGSWNGLMAGQQVWVIVTCEELALPCELGGEGFVRGRPLDVMPAKVTVAGPRRAVVELPMAQRTITRVVTKLWRLYAFRGPDSESAAGWPAPLNPEAEEGPPR